MTFGDRVRSNRVKHNMSQKDLAYRLNVTPQTIYKWENDLSEPELSWITEMTKIFHISHDELFVGNVEVLYKGSIYTAVKDNRMKKYYDFFVGFTAFLSLSMLITSIYVWSIRILPWYFLVAFGVFTVLLLMALFMTSTWRNQFMISSDELIDVYVDRIELINENVTLYQDKIQEIRIKGYSFLTGIRIYDDTGYIKVMTKDNQKFIVRDISELNDLKHVILKMKNEESKEEKK